MITHLTNSQIALFPEFVDKWTAIGLSTAPASREDAELGIIEAYTIAGLQSPKIIWTTSPLVNGFTRGLFFSKNNIVRSSVGASVRDSVWDSVGDSVMDSVGYSVWDSVRSSVMDSVGESSYGQHDAGWLSFYDYFNSACGLKKETKKISGLLKISKSAGWFLPHEKICWVSDRHNIVNRDGNGRLHNNNGIALAYPDGWGIYAVHGVRVPKFVIERPTEIKINSIDAEKNIEVRRVMIDRYDGVRYTGAFLIDSGAKEIHRDDFGILYRRDVSLDEPIVMVKVKNSTPESDGSCKDYFLRVPPNIQIAHEAVQWTFGSDNYSPAIES